MRLLQVEMNVPTAAGPGTSALARDLRNACVQVGQTFTGSLSIQVSLDGQGLYWQTIHTGIAAPGLFQIGYPASHVRVVVSSLTGVAPRTFLAGYYED